MSDFPTIKKRKNRGNLTELKWWREWLSGEIGAEYWSRGVPNLGKSGAWVRIRSLVTYALVTSLCGELTLELQRTPKRKPRTAALTVRFTSLELQPPQQHPQRSGLKPVRVQVVWAVEEHPPSGEKAISFAGAFGNRLVIVNNVRSYKLGASREMLALVQLPMAD